ncbi:MAG: PAS domain S-box protein, partial [Aliifodinibius sp.]|nr:PAS domain S-box protein [Fodinibius sp.]
SRGKIKRDDYGIPIRWTGINWDITKRKKAEDALYQSEERLRTVMEKIPSGIGVIIDGKIEYSNPTLSELTGYSSTELNGKSPIDLLDPKDREEAKKRIEEVLKGGEEYGSEYALIDRNGKTIPIEVDSRRISLDGKIGLLAIIRDITERKKAEEALNKYHEQLQQLSSHLQSVREEERKRISREIHDELGQALSILLLDISWLENHIPKENELPEKLNSMSTFIESTIKKVQKISSELRPSILDNLGLVA